MRRGPRPLMGPRKCRRTESRDDHGAEGGTAPLRSLPEARAEPGDGPQAEGRVWRDAALWAMRDHDIPRRRACTLVGVDPKTVRREHPPGRAVEAALVRARWRGAPRSPARLSRDRRRMMVSRGTASIRGKPRQNAVIGSFDGSPRDEHRRPVARSATPAALPSASTTRKTGRRRRNSARSGRMSIGHSVLAGRARANRTSG